MRTRRLSTALLAAVFAAGCTSVPDVPTDGPASASPSPDADASTRLVIAAMRPDFGFGPENLYMRLSNAWLFDEMPRLAHSALYRYDDTLSPVPDLAAEPCSVSDDELTVTCHLVAATFHDGTPVTADDVAFTYDVVRNAFPPCLSACLDTLDTVEAIDERTVEFRLTQPDATMLTVAFPQVFIESRAALETAYQPMADRADELDPEAFTSLAERIMETPQTDPEACQTLATELDTLLGETGLEPFPREYFEPTPGEFDPCSFIGAYSEALFGLAESVSVSGATAIGRAYLALPTNWEPMGAGPWRLVEPDPERLVFEAHDDHHHGAPAIDTVEFRQYRGDAVGAQIAAEGGPLWMPRIGPDLAQQLGEREDVALAEWGAPVYFFLAFNLREGQLFADHNLRTALEMCIDKPATVDAATRGLGNPIYSPVQPISWAYRDDLPRLERDIEEARRLIEESGWQLGEDGVYVREGERLATDVYVRSDHPPRVEFIELVSDQARDCGIELTTVPADPSTVLAPLSAYPHIPPGQTEPIDAMFLGWLAQYDPDDILFDSRQVSSEELPDGSNFMGYANPRVDELLDAGIATYDQRERARIYREYQLILAEDRPVIFAWADVGIDALIGGVRLTEGELNSESIFWWWQLEKLTLGDP